MKRQVRRDGHDQPDDDVDDSRRNQLLETTAIFLEENMLYIKFESSFDESRHADDDRNDHVALIKGIRHQKPRQNQNDSDCKCCFSFFCNQQFHVISPVLNYLPKDSTEINDCANNNP